MENQLDKLRWLLIWILVKLLFELVHKIDLNCLIFELEDRPYSRLTSKRLSEKFINELELR